MLILGLDPGSEKTGFALIEKQNRKLSYIRSGVIELAGDSSFVAFTKKMAILCEKLAELIESHHPDEIAFEALIYVKNPKSLMKLAQVRGAMLGMVASNFENRVFEYPPNVIKSVIVGDGHASKESVQKMLRPFVGEYLFKSHDESDAVAIALCHAWSKK